MQDSLPERDTYDQEEQTSDTPDATPEDGAGVDASGFDGKVDSSNPKDVATTRDAYSRAVSGRTRDLLPSELTGTEKMGLAKKLWLMHPFALLIGIGVLSSQTVMSSVVITGLLLWTALMMGAKTFKQITVGPAANEVVAPSTAVKAGMGIFGMMGLASIGALMTGITNLDFFVLNGAWGVLSLLAVYQASKSDAQTGWMTGASAMAVPCTFFGMAVALRAMEFSAGILLPVKLVPILCLAAVYQTWQYLSKTGRNRTKASLKALGLASLATVCYLPATTYFWGFSIFEAIVHLGLPVGAFAIPLLMSRNRLKMIGPADTGSKEPRLLTSS